MTLRFFTKKLITMNSVLNSTPICARQSFLYNSVFSRQIFILLYQHCSGVLTTNRGMSNNQLKYGTDTSLRLSNYPYPAIKYLCISTKMIRMKMQLSKRRSNSDKTVLHIPYYVMSLNLNHILKAKRFKEHYLSISQMNMSNF